MISKTPAQRQDNAEPKAIWQQISDEEIDAVWESIPDCERLANYTDQRKFARTLFSYVTERDVQREKNAEVSPCQHAKIPKVHCAACPIKSDQYCAYDCFAQGDGK